LLVLLLLLTSQLIEIDLCACSEGCPVVTARLNLSGGVEDERFSDILKTNVSQSLFNKLASN